jgi:hypothetical protein
MSFQSKKVSIERAALLRWVLLGLAAALVIVGVMQGDALTVLRKAVLICYECIGIG